MAMNVMLYCVLINIYIAIKTDGRGGDSDYMDDPFKYASNSKLKRDIRSVRNVGGYPTIREATIDDNYCANLGALRTIDDRAGWSDSSLSCSNRRESYDEMAIRSFTLVETLDYSN